MHCRDHARSTGGPRKLLRQYGVPCLLASVTLSSSLGIQSFALSFPNSLSPPSGSWSSLCSHLRENAPILTRGRKNLVPYKTPSQRDSPHRDAQALAGQRTFRPKLHAVQPSTVSPRGPAARGERLRSGDLRHFDAGRSSPSHCPACRLGGFPQRVHRAFPGDLNGCHSGQCCRADPVFTIILRAI